MEDFEFEETNNKPFYAIFIIAISVAILANAALIIYNTYYGRN